MTIAVSPAKIVPLTQMLPAAMIVLIVAAICDVNYICSIFGLNAGYRFKKH
jgi:hypothetical protein